MTTNYSMTDSLSKDVGGQKFAGWIDDGTSQLDFALPRGIGSEPLGGTSKIVAHLGVATHTIASKIETSAPGVLLLGAYTESPSAVGTGNANSIRIDSEGALYTRPASGILATTSASVQTHLSGSALLHDLHIVFSNVDAGDSVTIEDGDDYKLAYIATTASQHFSDHFATGLVFNTSLKSTIAIAGAGAGSVSLAYSQF
jgi:hypothetical protein